MLADDEVTVRISAAVAMLRIDAKGQEEAALPVVVRELRSPEPFRRWFAVCCLGEAGLSAASAATALEAAAEDLNPDVPPGGRRGVAQGASGMICRNEPAAPHRPACLQTNSTTGAGSSSPCLCPTPGLRITFTDPPSFP